MVVVLKYSAEVIKFFEGPVIYRTNCSNCIFSWSGKGIYYKIMELAVVRRCLGSGQLGVKEKSTFVHVSLSSLQSLKIRIYFDI